jgi:crotonobetainyl-CoA:carnitine CoA-transferase CaiB-like acyl-CoA transferase
MPESAHPSIVPFQAFRTADGWITVACAKQKFWERLCVALEREDLLADPRFTDFAARNLNRDALLPTLRGEFRARSTEEWLTALSQAGVPHGPVYDVAEALEDRQARARGDVVELHHPGLGTVRQLASPLRLSGDATPLERAPFRGEHTDQVLRELGGYSDKEIASLRAEGTFGQAQPPAADAAIEATA